ncbi:MAG: glucose-6-phosphate dehydrogenase assembly protein OpcA [Opitutales bacterium]
MKDLIDILPGIELSVGEVNRRLATMWEGEGDGSPSDARASQMNVVLHFGWEVTEAEAHQRFEALIKFAQRYPSRIIVLCPSRSMTDGSMSAKLFSQCYIGDSHREMCCCEALMLAYQPEDCGFLGNQVSVWLEPDLPTYHWFNRVPASRIEQYFDSLLVGVRRCLYDSSIEGKHLDDLNWPNPDRVSDLAAARLLPVRQAMGQYLSGYGIGQLCHGLKAVCIGHAPGLSGEAQRLAEWIQDCLADCNKCAGFEAQQVAYHISDCPSPDCSLTLEMEYRDDRYFRWRKLAEGNMSTVEASLGRCEERITTRVKPLSADQEIAEALFF